MCNSRTLLLLCSYAVGEPRHRFCQKQNQFVRGETTTFKTMSDGFELGTCCRVPSCRIHRWAVVGLSASRQERTRIFMNRTFHLGKPSVIRGLCALSLFPLLTSTITSLGWLVGQSWLEIGWWLAFAATVVLAFGLGRGRGLLVASGWALLTFFVSDILAFGHLGDYFHYHYPQVFFLERGWNPVFAPTMEALKATYEIALDTFRPIHTVTFPLLLAQWVAATDLITHSLGGFFWAVLLIVPAVGHLVWLTLQRWCSVCKTAPVRWLLVFLTLACGFRVSPLYTPVDSLLFLSQLALLLLVLWVMEAPTLWVRVAFCVAAWMLPGLKQSGILFLGVSCIGIVFVRLMRREWHLLQADITMFMALALAILFSFFHPYMTNWSAYGSPLFPAHSFLEAFKGWDVTIDLGEDPTSAQLSLFRFMRVNGLWVGLFAVACCMAWRTKHARKWLLPMAILLLTALLMPSRVYSYVRYMPTMPLITLLMIAVIMEEQRIPRWILLGAQVCCIGYILMGVGWRTKILLSEIGIALDLQTILVCAPKDAPGIVIVSTRANQLPPQSIYLRRTDIYPLYAHTFFLEEIFVRRAGLSLEKEYEWTYAIAQKQTEDIADILVRIRRESPLCSELTPRPLRFSGLLHFPLRVWHILKTRWFVRY